MFLHSKHSPGYAIRHHSKFVLMTMHFRKTCKHIRHDYETPKPIIVNNMKTEGIGYENESKSLLNTVKIFVC